MADAPVAPAVKPGYMSSELWLHVGAAVAICVLTWFQNHGSELGLPPLAVAVGNMVAPLALAWLAKNYGDSRADVKQAALAAGQAAGASQGASAAPGSPVAA